MIEDTIRESLPDGFQKSEYLFEHGMIDIVVSRTEIRDRLVNLLGLLLDRKPTAEIANMNAGNIDIPEVLVADSDSSGESEPLNR